MTDFLLELLSEEIPARMQDKARADLARLFTEEIAKAGLSAAAIETYATPRRLALIARGLPQATEAVREETKGPRASAPPQALEGFLRKTGLTREALVERDGVLFAVVERPGRATAEVLAEAVPAIVRAFPWPKSMRWGDASAASTSLRWVRPLHGIVALFGDDVVPCSVEGVESAALTVGHRFHHPGGITIGNADDYAAKLRACHVIVDQEERKALIREQASALATEAGLTLVEDEGLVAENAGLTEWPVPLLGAFDSAFLEVPREVIQLTMRTNQKYFACVDGEGRLAPNFVCTANIAAADGGAAIAAGNAKVLAARLSDARFFWEQDLKVPLAEQAKKLDRIVFHEKLGTVADKVERVAKLARWLVEEGIVGGSSSSSATTPPFVPSEVEGRAPGDTQRVSTSLDTNGEGVTRARLADMAEQAARLCKADLVTGMVGEFPELQGIMGGYYARAEGLPDEVADAIREQYGMPYAPIGVAVALADRLDTLSAFFGIDEKPTGSKDPFALRRAAIQAIFMIMRGLRLDLSRLLSEDVIDFLVERWMVQNRSSGGRADLIAAVRSVTRDGDLYRMGIRMRTLETFVATEDGANLLAGYRRAANIVRIETKKDIDASSSSVIPAKAGIHGQGDAGGGEAAAAVDSRFRGNDEGGAASAPLSYTPEPAEAALIAALDIAEPEAAAAVAREDFEGAMSALARLRPAVDAFFDQVTVNDTDTVKRTSRLALLDRIRVAMHNVADFSKIEG